MFLTFLFFSNQSALSMYKSAVVVFNNISEWIELLIHVIKIILVEGVFYPLLDLRDPEVVRGSSATFLATW